LPFEKLIHGDLYLLPSGEMFRFDASREVGQMGGFMDVLGKITGLAAPFANLIPGVGTFISMGLGAASGAISAFGGSGGVAKGLAGINAFGGQVMAEFDKLAGMVGQAGKREIDAEADKLVSHLSNPAMVYQAQKGKDAAALADFKQKAAAAAAQIKAATAAFETQRATQQQQQQPTTTTGGAVSYQTLSNGQVVAVPAQTDNTILYALGGAIILILLWKN
jgi:myo-inositol-1-phosphate synthase